MTKILSAFPPPFPLWAAFYHKETDSIDTTPVIAVVLVEDEDEENDETYRALKPYVLFASDGDIADPSTCTNFIGFSLTEKAKRKNHQQEIEAL